MEEAAMAEIAMDEIVIEEVTIAGVRCEIYSVGVGEMPSEKEAGRNAGSVCCPIFLIGTTARETEGREAYLSHLIDEIAKRSPHAAYRIVSYYRENWNRDFSPWKAAPAFGEEPFGGEGCKTLQWLTEECIPFLKSHYCVGTPEENGFSHGNEAGAMPSIIPSFYTAGYSLAGLFALWAAYESDVFSGSVCCSGSLWFPGWKEYVEGKVLLKEKSLIYLSLGGKEARTRNAVMATIADATRAQEKLLKADPHVRQTILEWNQGGHFADSAERLAKGIAWVCKRCLF